MVDDQGAWQPRKLAVPLAIIRKLVAFWTMIAAWERVCVGDAKRAVIGPWAGCTSTARPCWCRPMRPQWRLAAS